MTYDNAFKKLILLSDVSAFTLQPASLSEVILLRVYYKRTLESFNKSSADINGEDVDENVKQESLKKLAASDCGATPRGLSESTFGDIVAEAMKNETVNTHLFVNDDGSPKPIDTQAWLMLFAEEIMV